ncbi:ABC transporter substrate-binding protein [Nonomuraea sp. NPDC050556]|uniref:ABC transporter substrate-binding protein n=1 Tax=Nonomuraea sp. NPDC050556 TaxID=3364369 RepID=UPI0037BB7186
MARRAAAVVSLLMLAGCAGTQPAVSKDTLVWATSLPVHTLDIAHGFDVSTAAQFSVLEGPVTLDKSGQVVPALAESWTETEPGVYDFRLRKGVTFSDGSPVTADDVAYSLERHTDPEVASEAASYVALVKSVKATGPDGVRVTLSQPNTAFLATAALAWQVVPRKLAEAHPKDLGNPEVGTLGTGPFKVARFSLTDGVTLVRNDRYWGTKPELAKVEFKTITNPEALRLAIKQGSVDGTADLSLRDARKWAGIPGVKTGFYASDQIAFLSLDVTDKYLKDVHVRRAIAYALDKEALVKLGTSGHGTPADALLTGPQITTQYGDKGSPVTRTYPHDLAKAKAELAQSAYPDGFALSLPYASGGEGTLIMQAIAADLAKIGIRITIDNMPADAYRARSMDHDRMGIQLHTLGYGTPDPAEVLPDLLTRASAKPQGWNFAMYASAGLDATLDKISSMSGEARLPLVTKVLNEVADQVPYVPLYYPDQGYALSDRFTAELNAWTLNVFSAIRPVGR